MFFEKSVAIISLHLGAITLVSIPVPQAHSSTVSVELKSGSISLHRVLCVLAFIILTNTSYTTATLSQNTASFFIYPPYIWLYAPIRAFCLQFPHALKYAAFFSAKFIRAARFRYFAIYKYNNFICRFYGTHTVRYN